MNSHEGKFFLGDVISVADIIMFCHFEYYSKYYVTMATEYPELACLHESVAFHDDVKGYLDTRTTINKYWFIIPLSMLPFGSF